MQEHSIAPESTAVRVALWRAMHVQIDPAPHVLEDEVGLRLVAPDEGWQNRPDMHPQGTRLFRASIVARARFIEDLVVEQQAKNSINQYVILGAGLDSFSQRRPEIASRLQVFEVDQPGPQQWKCQRFSEVGFGLPDWLHFVPVNFEENSSWIEQLQSAGFDIEKPAVISSTGVSLYLTKEAISATLRQIATLASGTVLAMTFILPLEFAEPEERPGFEAAIKGAQASGTPFLSFFTVEEMIALAKEAGFKDVYSVSGKDLTRRYFADRADGLHPGSAEALLIAIT